MKTQPNKRPGEKAAAAARASTHQGQKITRSPKPSRDEIRQEQIQHKVAHRG